MDSARFQDHTKENTALQRYLSDVQKCVEKIYGGTFVNYEHCINVNLFFFLYLHVSKLKVLETLINSCFVTAHSQHSARQYIFKLLREGESQLNSDKTIS